MNRNLPLDLRYRRGHVLSTSPKTPSGFPSFPAANPPNAESKKVLSRSKLLTTKGTLCINHLTNSIEPVIRRHLCCCSMKEICVELDIL